MNTVPLACVPNAIPGEERANHFELMRRLFDSARENRPHDNGYSFLFDSGSLLDVARFVDNERRCCPFLRFEIVQPDGGSLWLHLAGPEGTRRFLEAELSL